MKILFIIAKSPYDAVLGGAENFVRSVAERLAKKHEVHILSKKMRKGLSDNEKINGVHLHRYNFINIPKSRWITEPVSMYRTGLSIAKEHNIDVIVPCILYPAGAVGVKIAKKLKKPSFLSLQTMIFKEQMSSPLSGRLSKFALREATRIHVISKFLEKNVLEYTNRPAYDTTVIYDGVDTDFFSYKNVDKTRFKKNYGICFPVISCVSHFKFPQKRQDLLVRALVKIRGKYPNVKLLFVGGGDPSKVKALVDELGLSDNVEFLGSRPPEDVREIMGMSDVFAFITSFEGMGIVAVEALAMGTPVVATNVGPLPELVRDGIDGKLTSLEVDEIADDIMETLSDKRLKGHKETRSIRVRKKFNWDDISKKIEKELLKLCKK